MTNHKQEQPRRVPEGRVAMTLIRVFMAVIDAGRKIGTHEVAEQLQRDGIEVKLRTVQRYLQTLKDEGFPIDNDGQSPQGWFAKKQRTAEEQEMIDVVRVMRRAA